MKIAYAYIFKSNVQQTGYRALYQP